MSSIQYDVSNKAKFAREIFISRILSAVVWSIFLQCLYVSYVLFLMNIDILHPLQWIRSAYSSITNVGTWFYLIPLGVMTFAQGVLMSKDFMTESPCIRTRFGTICSAFQPRNLVMAFLNMIFGAMIVSYYSALLGDETNILTQECGNEQGKCLNERNLYLIACGIWIGLYTTFQRQMCETRVIMFPMVQQLKYPQVKLKLGQLVMQSIKEAVFPYAYFCLLYWAWGGYLCEHLSGFLGVTADNHSGISVLFWMKPFLAIRCLLFSAIIILSRRTIEMLFEVFLTERCHFLISSTSIDQLTLIDVLASPLPFMQRLAYLDLLHIAERDPIRQAELFSLSLPGGHPHNWNGVVSEVLKALESFTSDLNIAICDMNRASIAPLLPSSPTKSAPVESRPVLSSQISQVSPMSPTTPSLRLRNMSIIQSPDRNNSYAGSSPLFYAANTPASKQERDLDLLAAFRQQLVLAVQWIRRKPGINLLFGELEDAHARYLLLHSQHLSWGAQALAHLAAASLKRDVYGVVQKDLPVIIKTIVQLKSALERLPLHCHKRGLRSGALEVRMKASLTSAVKRSLYILCNAFGPYLSDLPLSEDLKQVLGNYILYKEG
ncbi:Nucleoporin Ndc1 [Frankliniella fusca]|uniref:Nucleoporin Ndc1 n=1 Tax=Frankliniella fusca TaxID=407009 RepID=A0AAE1LRN4_9NEOP|nr:Nucleoporin Ndc1 [Frankliniella fusca]